MGDFSDRGGRRSPRYGGRTVRGGKTVGWNQDDSKSSSVEHEGGRPKTENDDKDRNCG